MRIIMKYQSNIFTGKLFLGVIFSLLCALFYSSQAAMVKGAASVLPPLPMVVFLQNVISLILFLPFVFKNGRAHAVKIFHSRRLNFQIYRTIFSLLLIYILFYSVKFIPLVNVMLLINTAPLMIPFVAYLLFSQKINHRIWLPIMIGFSGVVIVLNPDAKIFHWVSLLALSGSTCMATGMLCVRRAMLVDSADTTTLYFLLLSSVISGLIVIPFWQPLKAEMVLPLLTIGGLYFLVQCTASYALKFTTPQLVSTLFYSNIIFAVILSDLVWHTELTYRTLLGIILIVSGGILCIRAEYRAGKPESVILPKGMVIETE